MEFAHLFITLVIISVSSTLFHTVVAIVIENDGDGMPLFFNPIDLYKHTKLNWVGVILIYLLSFVLCPLFVIGGLLKRNTK